MSGKTASMMKSEAGLRDVWRRLRKNPLAMFGLGVVVLLIFCAITADIIAPYKYYEQNLMNSFQPPSGEHLFGTDEFGRDIFSRIIHGSRISLQVGLIAVGISVVCGGFFGAVAGYYGGRIDNLIMRMMDILLSIPSILLAIAIAAA
ncbi:MAG: ABC transporter permease, partial [Synergistota bacterium]|nr:ABC transporter permease [Synergistota bacterium]